MLKRVVTLASLLFVASCVWAFIIKSPEGNLAVNVDLDKSGCLYYNVSLDGKIMLRNSPLGFYSNLGDYVMVKDMVPGEIMVIDTCYTLDRIKQSNVKYKANEATFELVTPDDRRWSVTFRVSDNDVAFRYGVLRAGKSGSIYIDSEATGFCFPEGTTTFLTPQSDAMIGWKRTKPSYEEEYVADAPMDMPSQYGHGYTFPCLFKVGDDGWVLVSETGVGSNYCASHLSDYKSRGLYTVAFPMPEENNGNGNTGAAMALPGMTPWRVITVGRDLAPIVETTVPWDVVEPVYYTDNVYKYGRGTWSWILWQDDSINMEDQKKYVDLARDMGYEYILIDNWWDVNIGRDRLPELLEYAHSQDVDVFMWYSSSGYWNDIVQGPINCMDNPVVRKREMRWLKNLGVKGIKVDFFGGDKQETMRLYEAILSDADDNGLMVIFHGCTLPRGWERMYPNYVGSEAVLASENLIFNQHFCDHEAYNATLHPFIRNTVGSMEFGGCFMNKYMSRDNRSGTRRVTSDVFQLATAILFQNPIQNFALAPNNIEDAPVICLDFMREVPTTWDEIKYIAGYPGRYVVLARRHGDKWYIAGVNATDMEVEVPLPHLSQKEVYTLYSDGADRLPRVSEIKVNKKSPIIKIKPREGVVIVE